MSNTSSESIKILIIDDHAIVRAGLRMLIESRQNLEVVGETGCGADALASIAREKPDIILLDLDLDGENGLDLLPNLIAASANARDHFNRRA